MDPSPAVPAVRRGAVPAAGILVVAGLAACAPAPPPPSPAPEAPPGDARPSAALPDLPRATGPLELRVSYPRSEDPIAAWDSTFVFGSTGHGDARLTIDGTPVEVRANGAFLAFLPVPADGVYHLAATAGAERATLEVPVTAPDPPPAPVGAVIVPGSVQPRGWWYARPGERVDVEIRGTPGGAAALVLPDGTRVPLLEAPDGSGGVSDFEVVRPGPPPSGEPDATDGFVPYRGSFPARPLLAADTAFPLPTLSGDGLPDDAGTARVELRVGGSVAAAPLDLTVVVDDPALPRVGRALDARPPERNGDGHVNARPGPGGGPYHYTWRNGTLMEITGERTGTYRVRLAHDLDAWTPVSGVELLPAGTPPPTSRVSTVRMAPADDHVDVHVGLDRALPYRVEEGERSLTITVFGALSQVNFVQHGGLDPYVRGAGWRQPTDRRFELRVDLAAAPWGWEVAEGAGQDLVLRIRRPPDIDPAAPLRGLTVGVDPGHGGDDRETMGPTGFTEADANLGIALRLRDLLTARGATVVMTRTDDRTVSLVERTELARARDVDLWVSVHNNAFPDGIDPFANHGTSVYYNHPKSAGLARAVQRELLAETGLRDLGVGRADLHPARFAWAPAILTENLYMMVPEQEALVRSEEGQRRIAAAHVRGIEAWLREWPGGR